MLAKSINQLITASIFAGALTAPSLALADGKGFYLGAGAYAALLNDKVSDDDNNSVTIDDSSVAWGGELGWRFNKWISIDVGYANLGNYKDTDDDNNEAKTDIDTWKLGAMVSIPIWIIDIYGRGGAAWWGADQKVDFTTDSITTSNKNSESGRDWYYGLGLAFNLGPSLDLYLEWQRYDFDVNFDTAGVGFRYTF